MSLLLQLPTELVMKIIGLLDWRSLLACSEVCVVLRDAITSSRECQYAIELPIAGMEDGPPSNMVLTERLQRLRDHQAAWRSLQWRTDKTIDMLDGGVWELYGGVLAHARGRDTLVFNQLPSAIRGIPEHSWEVTPSNITSIRDFAMEPACDLLVLIEDSTEAGTFHVHLRSMQTGQPHQEATKPAVLSHTPEGEQFSFAIQISGDHIGILFICSDEHESQILIWDWRTGICEMALKGQTIGSFGFLDHEHILVGIVQHQPLLQVMNFKTASSNLTVLQNAPFECALRWPTLQPWAVALAMSIRSDPSPGWRPHPDLKVPFQTAQNGRLFAITLWVAEGANIYTLLLFVPFSTVTSHLKSLATPSQILEWEQWGPEGSRMMKAPDGHSMIWVCYIFGQSFIAPWRTPRYTELPVGPKAIQILDFNQLVIKKELVKEENETAVTKINNSPHELRLGSIFQETVTTSLPYRRKVIDVPLHPYHTFSAVMLSEDSIVTVTSDPNVRQYRVLSF
ncbi:hypothetical protein BC835DRAFT_1273744 [Cytidiella melzeri]|nr:hypothetical protein BC835DRAFT_1273744 [Cytidiella melzeri]